MCTRLLLSSNVNIQRRSNKKLVLHCDSTYDNEMQHEFNRTKPVVI